ncbi:hypothetical protein BAE44_0019597 [Dichanthelium oligosanthes]|uniref:RING-type domain-containing protein n=1 Tax=Dichanthelium oligosanthes TaxID=888268 RepID=A0A1E5V309_9POAL|nr:hypothetical protein BAE44_0019597 [Dichanthelium oligosanthes]
MNLADTPPTLPEKAAVCTVCLDEVVESAGARSVALLKCGHKFHLECIGSAFNAKGIMQCPNCRNIENGNWLTANRLEASTDSDSGFGNGVTRGPYQVVSELIWQAFDELAALDSSELAALNSVFENREREPLSSGVEGDPTADLSNNVGTGTGTEPRNSGMEQRSLGILPMVDLANHTTTPFGFEAPRLHWIAFNVKGIMQCPNCRSIEESNWLIANRLRASTDSSYSGFGDPTADKSNVQVFDGTEPIRNSEIEQRYLGSIPLVDIISTTPFVIEVPGYDGSNQWRSTQYVLSLPKTLLSVYFCYIFYFSSVFVDRLTLVMFLRFVLFFCTWLCC